MQSEGPQDDDDEGHSVVYKMRNSRLRPRLRPVHTHTHTCKYETTSQGLLLYTGLACAQCYDYEFMQSRAAGERRSKMYKRLAECQHVGSISEAK